MKKQNINEGDIFLCKERYFIDDLIHFYKHKYYIVDHIKISDDDIDYYYLLDDDKRYTFKFSGDMLLFYFYTKQEMRHMKLNQIYEETES